IEKWYDASDNRWQVPDDVWREQPDGELFWTVRTIEASGLARKALPMRSIFRIAAGSLTSARPEPARTAAGNTLLEWKPLTQPSCYRIPLSAVGDATSIARRYLSPQPNIALRGGDDRRDAGRNFFGRVAAHSTSAKLIITGPPQSFVALPKRKAVLRGPGGQV